MAECGVRSWENQIILDKANWHPVAPLPSLGRTRLDRLQRSLRQSQPARWAVSRLRSGRNPGRGMRVSPDFIRATTLLTLALSSEKRGNLPLPFRERVGVRVSQRRLNTLLRDRGEGYANQHRRLWCGWTHGKTAGESCARPSRNSLGRGSRGAAPPGNRERRRRSREPWQNRGDGHG